MTNWTALAVMSLTLAACGTSDTRTARLAQTRLLGMSEKDLQACLGVPDQHTNVAGTDIFTYTATATGSGGLTLNLPLLGGISFAGSGYCHTVVRFDAGRVTEIRYTGDKDGLAAPNAYCAPIVRDCVEHPERPSDFASAAVPPR